MRNNASRDCRRNFHGLLYPTTSAWPAAGGDIIAARNHAAEPEGIPRPPPFFNPRSSFLLRLPFVLSYPFGLSHSHALFPLIFALRFSSLKRVKCNNVTSAEVKSPSRKPEREEI